MSILESEIERKIREYVKLTGGLFLKQDSRFNPSIPDRLVLYPHSLPLFIELKQEKGVVSNGQEDRINKLKGQGHRVHIIRSLDSFKTVISDYQDVQTAIKNAKRSEPKKRTKVRYTVHKR